MAKPDLRTDATIVIHAPVRTVFDAFSWELLNAGETLTPEDVSASRYAMDAEAPPASRVRVLQRDRDRLLVLEQSDPNLVAIGTYAFMPHGDGTSVRTSLEMRFQRRPFWGAWAYRLMFGGSVRRDVEDELRRLKGMIESGGPNVES